VPILQPPVRVNAKLTVHPDMFVDSVQRVVVLVDYACGVMGVIISDALCRRRTGAYAAAAAPPADRESLLIDFAGVGWIRVQGGDTESG
jgi:hypothetical protein